MDYVAHVFINGCFLGSHEGFFAPFEFDFSRAARVGNNELFVRVDNDKPMIGEANHHAFDNTDGDKIYAGTGPGYNEPIDGWHHCPPGMGIYQSVSIECRSRVVVRDLFIRPLPNLSQVEIWVEVGNANASYREIALSFSLYGRNFNTRIFSDRSLGTPKPAGPGISYYTFLCDIPNARLWEPSAPWLYEMQVVLSDTAAGTLDSRRRQFGVRTFSMEEKSELAGRLFLNGREIRLRGANTMGFEQRDVMEGNFDQLIDDLLLSKVGNMNFLRLTQRPVQDEVYDYCDRLGIMTQTDLPLFGYLRRNQFSEAIHQAQEMEHLIRSHPCNVMVSFINEPFPEAWGDKSHRHLTRNQLEDFFEAATLAVRIVNPDRVVKPVDGDYCAPGPGICDLHCYTFWYNGHGLDAGKLNRGFWQNVKPGWMYGCGEFGAEGLDRAEIIRKYSPADWLPTSLEGEKDWTPGRISKGQGGRFHLLFHDTQHSLTTWAEASQQHQAWGTRITTEAFRRLNDMNTCAIHHFIDAWPMGWMKSIVDVERWPKPAFFAYREALTPFAAQLRTDRWHFTSGEKLEIEAWVVNDTHAVPSVSSLRYQIEIAGKVVLASASQALVEPCRATFQGTIEARTPNVWQRTPAILRLALTDGSGKILHSTGVDLTFFPLVPLPNVLAHVLGSEAGPAHTFASCNNLSLVSLEEATLIIIDDPAALQHNASRVVVAVERGATALALELPEGRHILGDSTISVETCKMGARHFASRATGHTLVAGFDPQDFQFWHDPVADRVTPLAQTLFFADDWSPILLTSQEKQGQDWQVALLAAEKLSGQGRWIVCQLDLANRLPTNPVAKEFIRRILATSEGCKREFDG